MNVVVFSRDFPPDRGGVQTLMERLAAYLGPDTTVLTRSCPGDLEFDATRPYRVRRMPRLEWTHAGPVLRAALRTLASAIRFVLGVIDLARVVRKARADLVICAYPLANGLAAALVRRLTGCRFVIFGHGTDVLRLFERRGFGLLAFRLVARSAAAVVVHAEFVRDEVARHVPRRKIVIDRLGADSGGLDPSASPAAGVGRVQLAGRRVLLTVGRLERRKGHDLIVRALPEIARRHPSVLWIAVGDGPDRARIEDLIRRHEVGDRAILAGRLPEDELSRLLARADLFLMPSRRIGADVEGFGIVFLEAALFGVPSIGGNSGGVPDAVEDGVTGLLCDPEDPRDLAGKVDLLLADGDLRRRMGEAARVRAAARTWQACAAALLTDLTPLLD